MGATRGLNVVLGTTAARGVVLESPPRLLVVPAVVTGYIAAVTFMAARETEGANRGAVAVAAAGAVAAVLAVGWFLVSGSPTALEGDSRDRVRRRLLLVGRSSPASRVRRPGTGYRRPGGRDVRPGRLDRCGLRYCGRGSLGTRCRRLSRSGGRSRAHLRRDVTPLLRFRAEPTVSRGLNAGGRFGHRSVGQGVSQRPPDNRGTNDSSTRSGDRFRTGGEGSVSYVLWRCWRWSVIRSRSCL